MASVATTEPSLLATPRGRRCPAPQHPKPQLCSWLTSHIAGEGRGEQVPEVSKERNANPQLRTPVPTISGSLTVVPSEKGGKGETPTRLQGALSDLRGEGPQPQGRAGGQPEDILSVGLQAFHRERGCGLEVLQHLGWAKGEEENKPKQQAAEMRPAQRHLPCSPRSDTAGNGGARELLSPNPAQFGLTSLLWSPSL